MPKPSNSKLKWSLPHLGSLWMLVAAACFAIMGALVKVGADKFTSSELVFYRSVFGLLIIWLYIHQQNLSIKTNAIGKHIARGTFGFIALLLFFYAIANLPLATAITLSNTSALFLGLLTLLVLKEKPKVITFMALLVGFLGVILLLQPNIAQQNWFASLIGLGAGLGAAIAYLLVKQLSKLSEPDWRTVFYFTLISTLGSGIWMLIDQIHTINLADLPVLLGLGLSATAAQLAMTRAYRTGNTLLVASLSYATVVISSLFGVIFWQEHLSMAELLAIALIIASGIASIYVNTKP